jgi:hypothetical protein
MAHRVRAGESGERSAQGRIRRQDAVVAMAVHAGRRDEGGEPVDEL